MSKRILSIALLSLGLVSSVHASQENFRLIDQGNITSEDYGVFKDTDECHGWTMLHPSQQSSLCFSKALERRLGLDCNYMNLFLAPDLLTGGEEGAVVLAARDIAGLYRSPDKIKSHIERLRKNFAIFTTLIMQPETLSEAQQVGLLRKLAWVRDYPKKFFVKPVVNVSDGNSDDPICLDDLPAEVMRLVYPSLDDESLCSLAAVNRRFFAEIAPAYTQDRLNMIRTKIMSEYHTTLHWEQRKWVPFLSPLCYLLAKQRAITLKLDPLDEILVRAASNQAADLDRPVPWKAMMRSELHFAKFGLAWDIISRRNRLLNGEVQVNWPAGLIVRGHVVVDGEGVLVRGNVDDGQGVYLRGNGEIHGGAVQIQGREVHMGGNVHVGGNLVINAERWELGRGANIHIGGDLVIHGRGDLVQGERRLPAIHFGEELVLNGVIRGGGDIVRDEQILPAHDEADGVASDDDLEQVD